jgi:hypothetical protein
MTGMLNVWFILDFPREPALKGPYINSAENEKFTP